MAVLRDLVGYGRGGGGRAVPADKGRRAELLRHS